MVCPGALLWKTGSAACEVVVAVTSASRTERKAASGLVKECYYFLKTT